MAEKPITFCPAMVRAILAGRKTVTRRVIVPQPFHSDHPIAALSEELGKEGQGYRQCLDRTADGKGGCEYDYNSPLWKAPYQPGDILWVREALRRFWGTAVYVADKKTAEIPWRWKRDYLPSIFMPKEACRIWRQCVSCKPEGLRDMNAEEAFWEGCRPRAELGSPLQVYAELWNRLNAKRGYEWDTNWWVWRIEFERTEHANLGD